MSHWNHRVLRETQKNGTYWYSVREVFYNDSGDIYSYTQNPVDISGESVEDLREYVNWVLKSLDDPILISEDVVFVDRENDLEAEDEIHH